MTQHFKQPDRAERLASWEWCRRAKVFATRKSLSSNAVEQSGGPPQRQNRGGTTAPASELFPEWTSGKSRQPATEVRFCTNVKPTKALGLNVPNSLIDRADEVIRYFAQVWIWIVGTIIMAIGVALVHTGHAGGDPIAREHAH
jgi:hypothetical protein